MSRKHQSRNIIYQWHQQKDQNHDRQHPGSKLKYEAKQSTLSSQIRWLHARQNPTISTTRKQDWKINTRSPAASSRKDTHTHTHTHIHTHTHTHTHTNTHTKNNKKKQKKKKKQQKKKKQKKTKKKTTKKKKKKKKKRKNNLKASLSIPINSLLTVPWRYFHCGTFFVHFCVVFLFLMFFF